MGEKVQIDFLDIEENEEYKKIIEKVVQECFKEEKTVTYTHLKQLEQKLCE